MLWHTRDALEQRVCHVPVNNHYHSPDLVFEGRAEARTRAQAMSEFTNDGKDDGLTAPAFPQTLRQLTGTSEAVRSHSIRRALPRSSMHSPDVSGHLHLTPHDAS